MRTRFRFNPPGIDFDPALSWVLERAFGPPEVVRGAKRDLQAETCIELAGTLDLAVRIGARTPRALLEDELGENGADRFFEAHRQAAARCLLIENLCTSVAETVSDLGVSGVFLKGAAMLLAGHQPAGSRSMADIDVLTRQLDAPDLQQRLQSLGWREIPGPSGEHQLQLLTHTSGLGLEVHTMVRGVRVAGSHSATIDELLAGNLCAPLDGPLQGCFRPADELLLAHFLVHGIAQHGLKPRSYPMTRLIADAQDLCSERERWDELLPKAMPWIGRDVSGEEAEAVRDLALRFRGGEKSAEIAAAGGFAGHLLRHILGGVLDDRYRQSLRLRSLAHPLAARSRARTLARDAFHTVWLTRPQVEMLYGTPSTPFAYWGWRLWRPVDLLLRSARYGSAWLVAGFRRQVPTIKRARTTRKRS